MSEDKKKVLCEVCKREFIIKELGDLESEICVCPFCGEEDISVFYGYEEDEDFSFEE